MSGLMSLGSAEGSPTLAVMMDAAIKATVLIVTFLVVHLALGERRAVVRSALWNSCLIGLLILPAASLALPRLHIFLPAVGQIPAPQAWPAALDPLALQNTSSFQSPGKGVQPVPGSSDSWAAKPAIHKPTGIAANSQMAASSTERAAVSVGAVMVGFYASVALLLIVRLTLSLAAVSRLIRPCRPVDETTWTAALDRWRAKLELRRDIRLLSSEKVSVPMVIGWLRASIVLPATLVGSESAGLIDAILLHELGHIRRADYGWNLVCKVVQIVYWPHPLVWLISRIVGSVREQVCDDLCVHGLGGGLVYRDCLVEVASGLVRWPDPALGLAMARATNLGRRVRWIDRTRGDSRCLLRWPARAALATTVLAFVGMLGSIEVARATTNAVDPPADSKPQKSEEARPQVEVKGAPEKAPAAIEILVLAKDSGKRLAGATVRPSIDFTTQIRKTDREGKVRIDLSQRRFQDSFGFDVWADAYVQRRFSFSQNDARFPKIPSQFKVELLPGEQSLGGKVVNEEGKPIAGVKVVIWGYIDKKIKDELAYMVDATTDTTGQWRCRCFRNMKFAYLYLSHPDYVSDGDSHPRQHGKPLATQPDQPDEQPLVRLLDFSDVQIMSRGIEVAGKVVDDRAQPVAAAEVGWLSADEGSVFHDSMLTTIADSGGRFRLPHVRPGRFSLLAQARGHAPELKRLKAEEAQAIILKLAPPHTLGGRVTTTGGEPLSGVFVNVDTWRGCRALGVFLTTDAQGRFRWEDAPADPVLINASLAGYNDVSMQSASPRDGEIRFTLRRSVSISGRINDVETGKPVDQVQVETGVPDPTTDKLAWRNDMGAFASQGHLQADVDVENTPEFRLRITAQGYEPFESRVFRRDERQVEYNVDLRKAKRPPGEVLSGLVRRPDGTPLEGASVAIAYPRKLPPATVPLIRIDRGAIVLNQPTTKVKTDAQGRFSIAWESQDTGGGFAVIIVHPEFFGRFDRDLFEANSTLTVKKWGRVEGMARISNFPARDAEVTYFVDGPANAGALAVENMGHASIDPQGRFVLDRVVPGVIRVGMEYGLGSERRGSRSGTVVEVKPGETARMEIGGTGRPVIARIAIPEGFDADADYTTYSQFDILSEESAWDALGNRHRRLRLGRMKLQSDGTLRAEDVPPGEYHLQLIFTASPIQSARRSPERFALEQRKLVIPPIPGGRSDEPFDLGELHPKPRESLKKP